MTKVKKKLRNEIGMLKASSFLTLAVSKIPFADGLICISVLVENDFFILVNANNVRVSKFNSKSDNYRPFFHLFFNSERPNIF